MSHRDVPHDRSEFLNLAGLFQGGLVVLAAALAWGTAIDPRDFVVWDSRTLIWGVGATIPIFALFLASVWFPLGPMRRIKRFLLDALGPSLAACRWYDLILLGLLAGFTEELLFRGVLQPWFESLGGHAIGLVAASLLFGLAHFITPTYAVCAALMGAYLGWLLDASGERNLLVPIITHALYDYLAFLVVVKLYRRGDIESEEEPGSCGSE